MKTPRCYLYLIHAPNLLPPHAEVLGEAGSDEAGCRLREGLGIEALGTAEGSLSASAMAPTTPTALPTSIPTLIPTLSSHPPLPPASAFAASLHTRAVSPPVLLSIIDTGVDYTRVLQDLISVGLQHMETEVMWWSESTLLEKRQAVDKHRSLLGGLSNRFTYLESAHDLLINGFTARDVTLTDVTDATDPYTTANEDAAPASEKTTPVAAHDLMDLLNVASTSNSILEASTIATYAESFNHSADDPEAETTTEVETSTDVTTAEATTEEGANTAATPTPAAIVGAAAAVTAADSAAATASPTSSSDESEKRHQNCSLCQNRVRCYCKAIHGSDSDPDFEPDTYGPDASAAGSAPISPTNVEAAAAVSPEDRTSQLLREAERLEGETEAIEQEQEPLTQIAHGLRRANSLLEPTQIPAGNTTRMAGQSTLMSKHRAKLMEDEPRKPERKKPIKPAKDTVSPMMDYSAPRPSTSFNNISKIDKISDPKDPLAPNSYDITLPALSIPHLDPDEAKEVKNDKDYVPTYSGRATSDSDTSIIEIHYRGPSNVWVTASEGSRRKQSQRGAKAIANAKIREALVSSQDRADSSYTHGLWVSQRRDTPQVSPSIPLNPATPSVPRAPVAFIAQSNLSSFVPTNELVLTGPSLTRDDIALGALMKRFEHASTSAVISQTGYRPPQTPPGPKITTNRAANQKVLSTNGTTAAEHFQSIALLSGL